MACHQTHLDYLGFCSNANMFLSVWFTALLKPIVYYVLKEVNSEEHAGCVIVLCRFTCDSLTRQSSVLKTLATVNTMLVSWPPRLVLMSRHQLPQQLQHVSNNLLVHSSFTYTQSGIIYMLFFYINTIWMGSVRGISRKCQAVCRMLTYRQVVCSCNTAQLTAVLRGLCCT